MVKESGAGGGNFFLGVILCAPLQDQPNVFGTSMSVFFCFKVTRDPDSGRFHESRFGPMMRKLDSAKNKARSINGIVRDEHNNIVAQALNRSLPLFCGEIK